MDAFCDPRVKRIIGMFSAQTAKTTCIENVIGYFVHHDRSPIMVVQPTLEIAEAFSKDRLAPMIRDTPALRDRFGAPGSKISGDTLLHKKFDGGSVTLAGANSFNSLASRPIRIVLGDEAAKWKPNEKGSPYRQVSVRVRGFWNSKLAFFSTPTDTNPANEFNQMWEESDKRLFWVPCPHCGENAVMTFDETAAYLPSATPTPRIVLVWKEGKPSKTEDGRFIRRAEFAWFECKQCGAQIDDTERHRAVRAGEWKPSQEFRGTAGFWGWQAMSPFAAAVDIANEWLGALGSPVTIQSAKNETLGLPYAEQGASPDWKRIFDRVDREYTLGSVPPGVLFLTAGVDVQKDRIEVQVVGWGRRRLCWLVDYQILYGDTDRQEVWESLNGVLSVIYQNAAGADFPIRKACVDTGYAAAQVYDWARRHEFGGIVALVKGGPDTQTALVATPSPVEVDYNGKKIQTGLKLHLLNVSEFKKDLYSRLALELPNRQKDEPFPDGFIHLCDTDDTEEFCRQLTAEQLFTRTRKGYAKREWEKTRPRNEALDTWVYAASGRAMLQADRLSEAQWENLEAEARTVPKMMPPPVQVQPQPQREMAEVQAPTPSRDSGRTPWIQRRKDWLR